MKIYNGSKNPEIPGPAIVMVGNENFSWYELDPGPSLKIRNHSPDGFQWGYGGSGPSQLALAILLDLGIDIQIAEEIYQKFKFDVIANLPPIWEKSESEFLESIERILREEKSNDVNSK